MSAIQETEVYGLSNGLTMARNSMNLSGFSLLMNEDQTHVRQAWFR